MSYITLQKQIKYQDYNFFYKGDITLLNREKIAIVGSRRPTNYTKEITSQLSAILSKKYTIVSGGAMGVDSIAHKNAKSTIMVSPAGLDIIYPKVNKSLIENIKNLSLPDKEELRNLIEKYIIEEKRDRIYQNYLKSLDEYHQKNKLKFSSDINELQKIIEEVE